MVLPTVDFSPAKPPPTGGRFATSFRGDPIPIGRGVVARASLKAAAAKEQTQTVAAAGALIPLVYGHVRTGALLARAVPYNGKLVLLAIWGLGEWEAIDTFFLGGEPPPSGVTVQHYLGAPGQGIDPTLAAAIPGWNNPLVKVIDGETVALAYSVVQLPGSVGIAEMEVIGHGKLVLPANGAGGKTYSENPARILADFESSRAYGRGRTIDQATVQALAAVNDELMADGARRQRVNVVFNQPTRADAVTDTLRGYAGALVRLEQGVVQLVPDRPADSLGDITRTELIVSGGEPQLFPEIRTRQDLPTVVRVVYTDKTADPWADGQVEVVRAGVPEGVVPRREGVFQLPGIDTHAEAYRWAVQRLNGYWLSDFTAQLLCTDAALAWQVGDVRRLNFSPPIRGVGVKLVRLTDIAEDSPGRYRVTVDEYDPAVWTDAVVSGPTWPDTDLPSPFTPPAPASVTLTEELYTDQGGRTFSRLRAQWNGVDWPFAASYQVKITGVGVALAATVAHQGLGLHEVVTGPVAQDAVYVAAVQTVSSAGTGVLSAPATAELVALGKLLPPLDVPSLRGFEAGQFVSLTWEPAADIDLVGYRIKRGSAGDSWATAALVVDRVDATTYLEAAVPPGSWRYFIKALDSRARPGTTDGESVNATYTDIEVTADAGSAVASNLATLAGATLTNMHGYQIDGVGRFALTSFGQTWAQRFGAAGTAWDAAPVKPWCLDHPDSAGSKAETAEWDVGADRTGDWAFDCVCEAIVSGSGAGGATFSTLLATAAAYPTFSTFAGKTVTKAGRYMQSRIEDARNGPDAALRIRFPLQQSLRGKPIVQSGSANIPAGGQPLTVVFAEPYAAPPKMKVMLVGSAPRIVAADQILATQFDLYAWDISGAAAAATVEWTAEGT